MYSVGRKCAENGKQYEKRVWSIASKCYFKNNQSFCVEKSTASFTNEIDLLCNSQKNEKIGIEIKKARAPDWQQCKLKYDKNLRKWIPSVKNKKTFHKLFEELLSNCNLYNGAIPPFIESSITHQEWNKIKRNTNQWNDIYIDIPDDTIQKMYQYKGCHYIQIGNGFGLYHLGEDICGFNVPEFLVPQQIRIRTKVHTRCNKKGFCSLSVMAACQPKNINLLQKSNFSLDDNTKLPQNLFFKL